MKFVSNMILLLPSAIIFKGSGQGYLKLTERDGKLPLVLLAWSKEKYINLPTLDAIDQNEAVFVFEVDRCLTR